MLTPARAHRERKMALALAAAAATLPVEDPPERKALPKSLAARKRAKDAAAASVRDAADDVIGPGDGNDAIAANDNAPARREATPEAMQRLAMAQAKRRLKALKSMEARAQLKRELLPEFAPWVAGVLVAADEAQFKDPAFRAVQDDVVISVLIWTLDVGDLGAAAHLFAFARRHGWGLPATFKRSLGTFVAEEAAAYANAALDGDRDVDLTPLRQIEQQVTDEDMPDEVRAQLHKALGRIYARQAEAAPVEGEPVMAGAKRARRERAIEHLQRALDLDGQSGVKGDLARLRKAVAKEDHQPADPPPAVKTLQDAPAGDS